MYIDFHVHSIFSDGIFPPEVIVKHASRKVNGLAFTDHIGSKDYLSVLNKRFRIYGGIERDDFIVIPGVEFSIDIGHVVVLFPNFEINFPNLIVSDISSLHEIVDMFGGVTVAAHIFRSSGVGERIYDFKRFFDAVEVYPFTNDFDVFSLKIPLIAGSDSHTFWTIGFASTFIYEYSCSIDNILNSIICGRIIPVFNKPYILRKLLDTPHMIRLLI
ncbi:MAG: PHP-associated domain-containing protein [Candidatus Methanomethylicia archaeon]